MSKFYGFGWRIWRKKPMFLRKSIFCSGEIVFGRFRLWWFSLSVVMRRGKEGRICYARWWSISELKYGWWLERLTTVCGFTVVYLFLSSKLFAHIWFLLMYLIYIMVIKVNIITRYEQNLKLLHVLLSQIVLESTIGVHGVSPCKRRWS